ncbi:MAG TPA: hypothetical protein VK031_10170, partial [Tissierellaceae bacterium]|nr:hypothetical protein [Tissierellaceae bacterium]
GLILTISRKYNIEYGQTLDGYKVIRKYIKDNKQKIFKDQNQIDSYFDLVHTRNSAVHGSVGRGTQNYLEQQEHFEELFKNGINIYEYITR